MSFFDVKEADLEPLRAQILTTSGIDPASVAGYVVIVCTQEDGRPGARVISSSPKPATILQVIELVAADLRRQLAEMS